MQLLFSDAPRAVVKMVAACDLDFGLTPGPQKSLVELQALGAWVPRPFKTPLPTRITVVMTAPTLSTSSSVLDVCIITCFSLAVLIQISYQARQPPVAPPTSIILSSIITVEA